MPVGGGHKRDGAAAAAPAEIDERVIRDLKQHMSSHISSEMANFQNLLPGAIQACLKDTLPGIVEATIQSAVQDAVGQLNKKCDALARTQISLQKETRHLAAADTRLFDFQGSTALITLREDFLFVGGIPLGPAGRRGDPTGIPREVASLALAAALGGSGARVHVLAASDGLAGGPGGAIPVDLVQWYQGQQMGKFNAIIRVFSTPAKEMLLVKHRPALRSAGIIIKVDLTPSEAQRQKSVQDHAEFKKALDNALAVRAAAGGKPAAFPIRWRLDTCVMGRGKDQSRWSQERLELLDAEIARERAGQQQRVDINMVDAASEQQ